MEFGSRDLSQAEKKITVAKAKEIQVMTTIFTQNDSFWSFWVKIIVKFIYSEKATNFCQFSTLDLSFVVTVKSTVEILKIFVPFSEYMNFNYEFCEFAQVWQHIFSSQIEINHVIQEPTANC